MSTAIPLPAPFESDNVTITSVLRNRRSSRAFLAESLPLTRLSQLLWAAQGIAGDEGRRTAPSAGALYPLSLYVACGDVEGLPSGVYRYRPGRHTVESNARGDRRSALAEAALGQSWIADGAVVLCIAAEVAVTTARYGERGARYVLIEAGAVAQNIALQACAIGMGTVVVAAFDDSLVKQALALPRSQLPLVLMPVGMVLAERR